jgi:hypothetical protein
MVLIAVGVIPLEGTIFNVTGIIIPFILLSGLIYTYFSLIGLLKEYHV